MKGFVFAGKKLRRGFTLIEMVVALSITTIVFGLGLVTYQNFSKKQTVEQAALNLKADLHLTKDKALSGQKPTGWCFGPGETLSGWRLDLTTFGYEILPVCSGGSSPNGVVIKTISFPTGVTSNATDQILFKVLSQGVNSGYTIVLSDVSGNSQTISINNSGLIN